MSYFKHVQIEDELGDIINPATDEELIELNEQIASILAGDALIKIWDGTYTVGVTSGGRLKVSQDVTAPEATTPVQVTDTGNVTTTADNVYVIPNTENLTIQRLNGGGEEDISGNVIELFYDPAGTGTGMTLIDSIFCSGNSDQHDLDVTYTGDGTAAIRMRRRRLGGGAKEIFGRWDGYY